MPQACLLQQCSWWPHQEKRPRALPQYFTSSSHHRNVSPDCSGNLEILCLSTSTISVGISGFGKEAVKNQAGDCLVHIHLTSPKAGRRASSCPLPSHSSTSLFYCQNQLLPEDYQGWKSHLVTQHHIFHVNGAGDWNSPVSRSGYV